MFDHNEGYLLMFLNVERKKKKTYLVTLKAMQAAWLEVCRVPISFSSINERPHDAPR